MTRSWRFNDDFNKVFSHSFYSGPSGSLRGGGGIIYNFFCTVNFLQIFYYMYVQLNDELSFPNGV